MALHRPSNPLDQIREDYRRQQARSPRAPAEPTPERLSKAAGVGHKMVGRREVRKLLTTMDILERNGHMPRHLRSALEAVAPWLPRPWRLRLTTTSRRRPG
jgi:hypothetical protein